MKNKFALGAALAVAALLGLGAGGVIRRQPLPCTWETTGTNGIAIIIDQNAVLKIRSGTNVYTAFTGEVGGTNFINGIALQPLP